MQIDHICVLECEPFCFMDGHQLDRFGRTAWPGLFGLLLLAHRIPQTAGQAPQVPSVF